MKKLPAVFFILMLFPLISSVEITLNDNFAQGETLTAKVTGDFFKSVSDENVIFYKGHVRTSIIPHVTKIGNNFYIYAQLEDKSSGDYSLALENLEYFRGSQIVKEDVTKNFTITNDTADFSVEPGVVATNGSFNLELKNLREHDISVSIGKTKNASSTSGGFFASLFGGSQTGESADGTSSATLSAGESKKVNFDFSEDKSGIQAIHLSSDSTSYDVVVYVFSTTEKEKKKEMKFDSAPLNVSLATNSEAHGIIYLKNSGDADIENISIVLSESLKPFVSVSISRIDSLGGNSSRKIEINVSSGSEEENLEGQITASAENLSAYIPVYLNFVKDYIPANSSLTCSQLSGSICAETQECSGETKFASDGVCCLKSCNEVKKSSFGKIAGWTIFLAIILAGIWFYLKKYKNVESVSDLMKVIRNN